jgi:CHAD domain-containing protein
MSAIFRARAGWRGFPQQRPMKILQQGITLTVPQELVRTLVRHPLFAAAHAAPRRKSHVAWFDSERFELSRADIGLCLVDAGRSRLQRVSLADGAECVSSFGSDFDFLGIASDKARARLERAQRRGLRIAFETRVYVRNWSLALAPDAALTARLAQGELRSGERVLPLCELQLVPARADDTTAFCVARDLIADLGLRVQPAALEERGLRLARDSAPQPARSGASPVTPQQDCAAALRAIVDDCIEQFRRNEPGALASDDPEYIHQLRVSIRRMRSALRAFAPLIPAAVAQRFVPGLHDLAGELGGARDWDVLLEELILPVARTQAGDPRLTRLADEGSALREAARAQCRAALARGAHHRLLAGFAAHVHCDWRPDEPTPELVRFAAQRLEVLHRKAAKAARGAGAQDIATLHRLRIAIKRLRYTVEFFAPLFARKAVRNYLGRMASLQEDLGVLNDLANAELRLADCARENPVLAEGVAFVHGWYATRLTALLQRIPAELAVLGTLQRYWKDA